MPISSSWRPEVSGATSIGTPSATSRSALPERDETARLPCLATVAPAGRGDERRRGRDVERAAAVAAGAAGVDDLGDGVRHGTRPRPHRLDGAGDLVRGLALHREGDEQRGDLALGELAVHDPAEERRDLGSRRRSSRSSRRCRSCAGSLIRRPPAAAAHRARKLRDDLRTGDGQNRLGVELDPPPGKLAVTQRHDDAVVAPGDRLELRRQRRLAHLERVVARGLERVRHPGEDPLARVPHRRGLAVHQDRRAIDRGAERLPHRLVAETDAEDRQVGAPGEQRDADPGLRRPAGTGREQDSRPGASPGARRPSRRRCAPRPDRRRRPPVAAPGCR